MLFKRRENEDARSEGRYGILDPSEEITETSGATIDAVAEEPVIVRTKAVIGESICIKGDVTGDEDLLVEGRVEGSVSLPKSRLTVGENGNVCASVNAKALNVQGRVDGDVNAGETVVLSSSAKMQGNIKAPRITIQDGCRFKGTIDMEMDPPSVVTDLKPSYSSSTEKKATDKHAS